MATIDTDLAVFYAAMAQGIRACLAGDPYAPGVDPVEANEDHLDGYQHGWHVATQESYAHDVVIKRDGGHGYPYRAHCPCGWKSNTYAAAHAAGHMGDDHILQMALGHIPSGDGAGMWGRR